MHGVVFCIWVWGGSTGKLNVRIEVFRWGGQSENYDGEEQEKEQDEQVQE